MGGWEAEAGHCQKNLKSYKIYNLNLGNVGIFYKQGIMQLQQVLKKKNSGQGN